MKQNNQQFVQLRNQKTGVLVWRGRARQLTAVLSLMETLNGKFGRTTHADVLSGTITSNIYQWRLFDLPEFGLLSRSGRPGAYAMLRAIEEAGLIECREKAGAYLLLWLTSAGRRALEDGVWPEVGVRLLAAPCAPRGMGRESPRAVLQQWTGP
jgi:hypothetical protein